MCRMNDERRERFKRGLSQLSRKQLQAILDFPKDKIIYDTWNFEKETGRY